MEAARRAEAADVAEIERLACMAQDELTPNRGGAVWRQREAHPAPVEKAIVAAVTSGDDRVIALLGTIDEVPVGYTLAREEDLHDGTRMIVISDIYVVPDAREVGVGEAMLDQVVEIGRARGAIGIDAIVLPGDRSSKNFFESFGLKARAILVHRSLVEAEQPAGDADTVSSDA